MALVLRPSEYQGDPNTAVGGRVVLRRKVNLADLPSAESSGAKGVKGKGKGKAKGKSTDTQKCEVHVLGGSGMQEMLFVECWGNGAEALYNLATGLIRIQNARIVPQRPRYSTSKLQYYLRLENSVAVTALVQPLADADPWTAIPQHHPFVDVAAMRKVPEDLQCCVLAVVVHQPGAVVRTTQYGESLVCNPVLRVKDATIRASFWRTAANEIAAFPQGSAVALYQVTVKKLGSGPTSEWELRASRSTCIEQCPQDLRAALQASTDLNTAATESLTREHYTDFDTVQATPCNVGGLASLLMPGYVRELTGVYELHNVNVLGINAVLNSGSFCIRCCSKCKKQIAEGEDVCANDEHSSEAVVQRWIARVSFSDATGEAEAIVYHDALEGTGLFPEFGGRTLTDAEVLTLLRRLRTVPWSMRLVYNRNENRQENTLEVKLMLPTFTSEGLLGSWFAPGLPEVISGLTCPFALCADVSFDEDLGVTIVKGNEASNVRLLVRVLQELDDEDTAQPDTATGLRVTRRIRCAVNEQDDIVYKLSVAGLSHSVQWLLRATGNSVWMVLASKRGSGEEFVGIARENVTDYPTVPFQKYAAEIYKRPLGPSVNLASTDTPLKRRKMLDDHMPSVGTRADSFSTRVRWEDATQHVPSK